MSFRTLDYADGELRLIDQRVLPAEETYLECRTPQEAWHAFKTMAVRGAPALAIAAAWGLVLAARGWAERAPDGI